MRYRMNGLVVAVRCVLLGTVLVVAGCGAEAAGVVATSVPIRRLQ